jgi:hypothetical protein
MSLFTDLDFVSSVDMLALDPEIAKVAAAESITIDTPLGIAAQACDEVGQKILIETQAFSGFMPPFAMPYNQTAAVLNLVGPTINRSRVTLNQVVVSAANPTEMSVAKPSALKRYAIYFALYLFYRAAFYKKSNDRYDSKRKMYEEEIRKKYWPRVFNQGIPICYKPLATPGAIHEWNVGVWDVTRVSAVAGTNAGAAANYDVAVTWVDNTRYLTPINKGNSESAPSARVSGFAVPTAHVLHVDISVLNPPNGLNPLNTALGQGLVIPGIASGWNIYVGLQGSTLYLQNSTPIPILTTAYTLPGAPVLSGYQADTGQYFDALFTVQKTLMRG